MNTKELVSKLEKAVEDLVTLTITTTVTASDGGDASIVTTIDHINGHITTRFDEKFVTGPYQALRDFHAAREQQGAEIINGNIEVVGKLVALIQSAGATGT